MKGYVGPMVKDVSHRWLTYLEVAQAFGLPSAKVGESKAQCAKWERQLGNDGWVV